MTEPAAPPRGAQTLARGLEALRFVAGRPGGATTREVAAHLDVHRTIAHRLLQTLLDAGFVVRDADGAFRGGAGLLELAAAGLEDARARIRPVLRELADSVGAVAALLVREEDEAVALTVVSPERSLFHLAFHEYSRHPIGAGAAGVALRMLDPSDRSAAVERARARGWSSTFGEVEPGAFGLAAPVRLGAASACLLLITHREEVLADAGPALVEASRQAERAIDREDGVSRH